MAAKLKIMFACLTYTCLKSAQGHNSKPLTCGDYRVLGHQSVFQLDNFSKWPCQIFFNVNDKCRPRLLCSKFVLEKKKKNGICDFIVNQLSPDGNNGIQKRVCNALFFQGESGTRIFDINLNSKGAFECSLDCEAEVAQQKNEIEVQLQLSASTTAPNSGSCICGKQSLRRIVGGQAAAIGEFPWLAAIRWNHTNKAFCGGALITRKHLLTAAHCAPKLVMEGMSKVVAVFGAQNITNVNESSQVAKGISKITTHPKYNKANYDFDYAIFELASLVTLNDRIEPVCLPDSEDHTQLEQHDKDLDVAGWGKLETDGKQAQLLQTVRVRSMSNQICADTFYKGFPITVRMLCAWKRNSTGATIGDTCGGDSGGPLVMRRFGRSAVVGVVSWGMDCGSQTYPGVYARVYQQMDWIKEIIPKSEMCS